MDGQRGRAKVMRCSGLLSCSHRWENGAGGWSSTQLGPKAAALCSPHPPFPIAQIPIQFPANQHVDRTSRAAGLLANYRKSFCSTAQPSGKGGWGAEREQASNLQAGKGLQAEGREPAAAFYSHTHTPGEAAQEGVDGEAFEDTSPGSFLSLTQRAVWILFCCCC